MGVRADIACPNGGPDRHGTFAQGARSAPSYRGRRCVDADLVPVFGEQCLDEITSRDVDRFLEALLARGLTARSVNRILSQLRSMFAWYGDDNVYGLAVNPARGCAVSRRRGAATSTCCLRQRSVRSHALPRAGRTRDVHRGGVVQRRFWKHVSEPWAYPVRIGPQFPVGSHGGVAS